MRNGFVKYMRNMRDMENKDTKNLILVLLDWFLCYVMGCVFLRGEISVREVEEYGDVFMGSKIDGFFKYGE